MACNLRPFRDYDEHDVINLFTLNESAAADVTKGHMVMLDVAAGWLNASGSSANSYTEMIGSVGASFDNTVSQRYGVPYKVGVALSGSTCLGMTLYDVKETDENGELLKFNPRKAAEMEVALSGEAVPILTRGIVLYSGSQLVTDAPAPGAALYSDNAGCLTTTNGGGNTIGRTLGTKDANGHVLVRINL
jgi:hypothetical protein